ncbi:DsbA family protein [Rubellimicrobium rubrum]|uniref:DsbA family protein n=1 Tax=Rubellimicrobium rubrum TaxID=2585369 RepID=A0A5C4MUK9_9RHOB|nr:DsbA family protein [Rubellimicrobium rubrum]TNC49777.1 DsbA family protein [Rubellimicrobium rubrum]
MKRPVLFAALTSVFALGGTALPLSAWAQEAATPTPDAASEQAATPDQTAEAEPVTIPDMAQGAEDAPVTIIEYGSFTCPHCAAFHADQYQQLKTDYIDTGKVRFVFREVYFDRFGLWASMIARCGGEMRFFGISDILYDTQREWIGEGDPAAIADNLRRIGKTAGMDDATLDACLKDETQAEALVAWYTENAERDGIQSTPTFIINGETHSNMAYEELQQILEAELTETAQ